MNEAEKVGAASVIYATCLTSILIWDWLNTFHKEVKAVWKPLFFNQQPERSIKAKLTLGMSTFLFILVRYLCLAEFATFMWAIHTVVPYERCSKFQGIFPYFSAVVATSANAIMGLRAYAIWGRDKWVGLSLLILWVVDTTVVMWASQFTVPNPNFPGCIPISTSSRLNALYLATSLFDSIVLALTLIKLFQLRRRGLGTVGPVVRVLARDGILYFVLVFSANLLAAIFELQNANVYLKPVNASLATCMTSIFCSRIYFNLRLVVSQNRGKPNGGMMMPSPEPSWDGFKNPFNRTPRSQEGESEKKIRDTNGDEELGRGSPSSLGSNTLASPQMRKLEGEREGSGVLKKINTLIRKDIPSAFSSPTHVATSHFDLGLRSKDDKTKSFQVNSDEENQKLSSQQIQIVTHQIHSISAKDEDANDLKLTGIERGFSAKRHKVLTNARSFSGDPLGTANYQSFGLGIVTTNNERGTGLGGGEGEEEQGRIQPSRISRQAGEVDPFATFKVASHPFNRLEEDSTSKASLRSSRRPSSSYSNGSSSNQQPILHPQRRPSPPTSFQHDDDQGEKVVNRTEKREATARTSVMSWDRSRFSDDGSSNVSEEASFKVHRKPTPTIGELDLEPCFGQDYELTRHSSIDEVAQQPLQRTTTFGRDRGDDDQEYVAVQIPTRPIKAVLP